MTAKNKDPDKDLIARMREFIAYDPESGLLTWAKRRIKSKVIVGSTAGTLNHTGYVHIHFEGKKYLAHRLAWLLHYGQWPEDQIDHINQIKTDNRISNLREVGYIGNGKNQRLPRNNKSGVMGVFWRDTHKKWIVQIRGNGKNIYLGAFNDLFQAVCVRKSAEIEYGYHPNHGR